MFDLNKTMHQYTPDELIERYKAAFQKSNNKPIVVKYVNGWFKLSGFCNENFRRQQIINAIAVLERRAFHEGQRDRIA